MHQYSDTTSAPLDVAPRTANFRAALILVTTLFFMWGLSYGLLDVLNKHFQEALHVSKAQSGLLQAAYFGAYFVTAIPAALLMERFGYKMGIMFGLALYAVGALLFIPASGSASFPLFLFALFVIASGLGCLETVANPYVTLLGPPDSAEQRLNLSQSFNGLGSFIGPIIGGTFFFSSTPSGGDDLGSVRITYIVIAVVVLLIMALFARTPMHEIGEPTVNAASSSARPLLDQRHFLYGVVTQFFYVAAQVGVGAFFINYAVEHWPGITSQRASFLLSIGMLCFMLGRFVSTVLMSRIAPNVMLLSYAIVNIGLSVVVVVAVPGVSVIALIAMFFFLSIMFPTIFALGVKDLGVHTKRGASFQVMAIVGGALMPYGTGRVADVRGTAMSYLLPTMSFVIVAWYAWKGCRVQQPADTGER